MSLSTNEAPARLEMGTARALSERGVGQQTALFDLAPPPAEHKPFLNWAGGKARLLPKILPHFPRSFGDYYEPFLGGGATYFAVRARARGLCHLCDLNEDLVNVWLAVRDAPNELLEALEDYRGLDTADAYYAVRAGSASAPVARAARFVYLNQTAWNSLYRVNKEGVFNVPWGDRPFRGLDPDALRSVSSGLTATSVECLDFRESLLLPVRGDFVYLDPPYLPVSDTSKFQGYTRQKFYRKDLEALAELCWSLTERGVSWAMSNRDTPLVRELFEGARIERFTTRRSVAAQNARDIEPADSPEAIVLGGPEL